MDLCEFDGKMLLQAHGVVIPCGDMLDLGVTDFDTLAVQFPEAVVKAQMLRGGRGKLGLVQLASGPRLASVIADISERLEERDLEPAILIEERLSIRAEFYLAFTIDDVAQAPLLLFAPSGGIDIEQSPSLRAFPIDPIRGLLPHDLVAFFRDSGIGDAPLGTLCRLACVLYRIFVSEDALLLEINPLVLTTDRQLIAADAKIVLDDAAGFRRSGRHALSENLAHASLTPLERDAETKGFTFVELPGDVALMTAGAGLGMMLVDLLGQAGLRAACFVDGSAATTSDNTEVRLAHVFERARAPEVKAILFYQNLGSRDLKPRVEALLRLLERSPPPKPLYFGLLATYLAERNMTAAEGCALLSAAGHYATQDLRALISTLVSDLATVGAGV